MRALFRFSAFLAILLSTISALSQQELYPKKQGQEQPLHLQQLPEWLSFDGELRGRLEDQTALNESTDKGRLYDLTRARGAIAVTPLPWLTGYLQFQDTHALGLPLRDVASNQRDQFDFFQGFVDFHVKKTNLYVGRQELKFGDERVVGISDWTNNSRSWDGADLRIGDKNKIDLFTTSVVSVFPTSLDKHGAGLTFHGAEGELTTWVPRFTLNPFVLVRALPRVTSQQGRPGTETEVSFGSYYESTRLPLGFESSGTGVLQRGSYSNDSIHAGAAILRAGWGPEHVPGNPHFEGEYDYATGNPHSNAFRIGTYDQQYPSNHNAFGLVDLFGFQNIKQDRLNFTLAPAKNLQLLFQGGSLHVASVRDGVYASGGSSLVKAPTAGFAHDGIGSEFDASAKYIYHKVFVTNVGIGHLFPGYALTSAGKSAPLTLAYLQFTYRFRVSH